MIHNNIQDFHFSSLFILKAPPTAKASPRALYCSDITPTRLTLIIG